MIQDSSGHSADGSVTGVDLSIPLMHHDPSDLGSLILIHITQKARTLRQIILHSTTLKRAVLAFSKRLFVTLFVTFVACATD